MSSIPNINYTVSLGEEDGINETYDLDTNYQELIEAVKEYIEADCHAVVMDQEVVYNTYHDENDEKEEISHRQHIIEYMIREQLIKDPHRHLFAPLLRKNRDFSIEIFMFRTDPWKIVIHFNYDTKQFSVEKKE